MDSKDQAPSQTTLFVVTERMHATCAAYDVALPRVSDEKLRGQLQNFADENHQHLSLLEQHLREQATAPSAITQAAGNAAIQAAAWLQAKQVQLGQMLGTEDLFTALAQREAALVQAYGSLCEQHALDNELSRLANDQLSCAKERQRWLADPSNVAKQRTQHSNAEVTDEGRRDVLINTPKEASAENSDC